ncbi:MAG TPA: hypothetical protein VGH65_02090, partial [Verrucomicrobiaceae bacterium]
RMTQNRETGAEAARFGHKAAALIAENIGAKKLTRNSNEFEWNGKRVTIRTARQGNNQVGVLYDMLPRMHSVIAAFETAPNEFELLSLSPEIFQSEMRDSKTGKGRVGLVRKKVFDEKGKLVGRVNLASSP